MEKKNSLTLNKQNQKDLTDYCKLNDIEDVDKFFQQCFKQGFDIKKYGLLTENNERVVEYIEKEVPIEVIKYVEKETIREVPIEVIKEVEKIVVVEKEVPIEKIIEVIKEVPIEKIVEITKEVPIYISGETQTKIVEIIKEVPIEVIREMEVVKEVEKPNEKMGMLQDTLMKLRREIGDKDKTITDLNSKIEQLEKLVSNTGAVYMKGSNLSQNL
jgi:hypothetical protein